eukprot:TRINITY_DN11986_c1_g1_i1.p1 TRINITY_DN11986_c1_g1~~TRINITY_DN11986_c1_g1_i1.p1  ORF type:complete len:522 (-),score=39.29 TRINITY_DN11986_c1_g1_i1:80-1585(-)
MLSVWALVFGRVVCGYSNVTCAKRTCATDFDEVAFVMHGKPFVQQRETNSRRTKALETDTASGNISLTSDDVDVVEEIPSLSKEQIRKVMNWIKAETTMVKLPFCWKRSYGRGVGKPLSECSRGRRKIGALCYSYCPAGMKRVGFDCHSVCPKGFRDDGLYCRRSEYGRGAGYPWKFGDGLNDKGMYKRCEKAKGKGKCQKWGAIVYPKCKKDYRNFGCCICRPKKPNCEKLGLGHRFDLSCAKKIKIGDPKPMICKSNLERNGALCYKKCKRTFYGAGPVCWGTCDNSQVNCGAACAKTSGQCALAVVGQSIAPLILAANIASFGMAKRGKDAAAAGTQTVKVSGEAATSSSKVGQAMIKVVNTFEAAKNNKNVVKITTTLKDYKTAERLQTAWKIFNFGKKAYKADQQYRAAYAEDFARQTSKEISDELDRNFIPLTANYLKGLWGAIQLREMATANHWQIAQTTLEIVGIIDPTGVIGVVAEYAKPVCGDIVRFPKIR